MQRGSGTGRQRLDCRARKLRARRLERRQGDRQFCATENTNAIVEDLAVHPAASTWLRYWRDARPGDVIFVDWTSSSFADIDNVGIVTGVKGGEPLITQHTPNQRGVTRHYRQTRPPKLVDGRPKVHVWIAVLNLG
jgi:hypothetical protein